MANVLLITGFSSISILLLINGTIQAPPPSTTFTKEEMKSAKAMAQPLYIIAAVFVIAGCILQIMHWPLAWWFLTIGLILGVIWMFFGGVFSKKEP